MAFNKANILASVLTLSLLASPAAFADKGGNGNGHGKGKSEKHHEERHDDDVTIKIITSDREYIRDYLRKDYRSHCPPGLAKKNNGCLPPGQAKKYRIGYPLPDDVVFVPISDDLLRHLRPAPRGYDYVRVDKDVLLIGEASKKVIDAVTLLSAVGN